MLACVHICTLYKTTGCSEPTYTHVYNTQIEFTGETEWKQKQRIGWIERMGK